MHRSHPQIRENEKKDKGNLLLIEKELWIDTLLELSLCILPFLVFLFVRHIQGERIRTCNLQVMCLMSWPIPLPRFFPLSYESFWLIFPTLLSVNFFTLFSIVRSLYYICNMKVEEWLLLYALVYSVVRSWDIAQPEAQRYCMHESWNQTRTTTYLISFGTTTYIISFGTTTYVISFPCFVRGRWLQDWFSCLFNESVVRETSLCQRLRISSSECPTFTFHERRFLAVFLEGESQSNGQWWCVSLISLSPLFSWFYSLTRCSYRLQLVRLQLSILVFS